MVRRDERADAGDHVKPEPAQKARETLTLKPPRGPRNLGRFATAAFIALLYIVAAAQWAVLTRKIDRLCAALGGTPIGLMECRPAAPAKPKGPAPRRGT